MIPRRAGRTRRRAFSVFFLVLLIPGLLLGLALSTDAARVILANHQAGNAADNIAMAGATGIDQSNAALDTARNGLVVQRVGEAFNVVQTTGMLNRNLDATVRISELTPEWVSVQVGFTVKDLLVFGYFGQSRSISGYAQRSAGICRSGIDAVSCAYTGR